MGILTGNSRRANPKNNRFSLLLLLGLVAAILYFKDDVARWFRGETESPSGVRTERRSADDVASDDRASDERPLNLPGTERDSETRRTPANSDLETYLPAYTSGDQVIRHRGYTLQYEEPYEQAAWVVHRLTGQTGKAKRATKFSPDPLVKTGSALSTDYTRTGYDRGHLAPAGDFKYSQELTTETFLMSNMSPQNHAFNTGIWNDLEEQVRRWAKRDKNLIVVTGPVLKPGLPTIGQRNKVAVPEAYYKLILYPEAGQERAIAFLMPNDGNFDKKVRDFVVPIDEVERKTGLDFFTKLPDSLEKRLESTANAGEWYR
jgi:endonuclease G